MTPQFDLFGAISEMRDMLDTLVKRGKPVSAAELQSILTKRTAPLPAEQAAQLEAAGQRVASKLGALLAPVAQQLAATAAAQPVVTPRSGLTWQSQSLLGGMIGAALIGLLTHYGLVVSPLGVSRAKYEQVAQQVQMLEAERAYYQQQLLSFRTPAHRLKAARAH